MRRIALVGAGRLASSLARSFGGSIGVVAGRDASRVTAVAALAGARACSIDDVAGETFDVLWIATSDSALDDVSRAIASGRESWRDVVVIHSSGALGIASLSPFAERGAVVLALHPNASLRGDTAIARATVWGVTPSDDASLEWARVILGDTDLGDMDLGDMGDADTPAAGAARLIGIADEHRALYHAAASTAANFTVALFAMAARLYERAGVDPALAVALVEDFMRASVERSRLEGPSSAITGPIVRGDVNVVAAQRAAVDASAPEIAEAFDALATLTARLFTEIVDRKEG